MSCSDNVVRAGLTNKYKDIDSLISMLTYRSGAPSEQLLEPKVNETDSIFITKTYVAPISEFTVESIEISEDNLVMLPESYYKLEAKESGSILVVIKGQANMAHENIFPGYVGFVPAMTWLPIRNIKPPLLIYRAYSRV